MPLEFAKTRPNSGPSTLFKSLFSASISEAAPPPLLELDALELTRRGRAELEQRYHEEEEPLAEFDPPRDLRAAALVKHSCVLSERGTLGRPWNCSLAGTALRAGATTSPSFAAAYASHLGRCLAGWWRCQSGFAPALRELRQYPASPIADFPRSQIAAPSGRTQSRSCHRRS